MADTSKAQKLASARKKFKELKKEKKKSSQAPVEESESTPESRGPTPTETLTNLPESEQNAQLLNYFNGNGAAAFFDNYQPNVAAEPLTFFNNFQAEPQKSEEIADFLQFDTIKVAAAPPVSSNMESLQQLNQELTEINDLNLELLPSNLQNEWEIRNQQLAEQLNQEQIKTEQLSAAMLEYQNRLTQVETELRLKNLSLHNGNEIETNKLREELQNHVQTIGIFVAENTELRASLSQFESESKQKSSECEELRARLKTSRSRVADLEREVSSLRSEKNNFDSAGKEHGFEREKFIQDYQKLKEEKEELTQDLLEVREKLNSASEANLTLQQQLGEVSGQLGMSSIKIQQLTNGQIPENEGLFEKITQEKFLLEKQVQELTQNVNILAKEREDSNLQYQQYAERLNSQMSNLSIRLEQLLKENESLVNQEQNRIRHIGELEKQLQNLQNDQVSYATHRPNEDKAELEAALALVETLQSELKGVANEKLTLLADLEARTESVHQLEALVEELKGNQPDNAKLFAIMESDKVAASRAVAQNTEIKKRLESMEEVFVKLNDDKVDLTEKLTKEQKVNVDLIDKLQRTEKHLETLVDAVEMKDREVKYLREKSRQLDKEVLQSEQLTDRLRHYEAQDNASQHLQNELQEAQLAIVKLNDEINYLMKEKKGKIIEEDLNGAKEAEQSFNLDNNEESSSPMLDKEAAMRHLERKFLRIMEEIATLTEEKQSLEHLVLQLQTETETIGEYVALYQHQRGLLKQKAIEKDQQLTQLANDRELIKTKLEKLNELVRKLVLEKGTVPPELLEHHRDLNGDDLCEEHAKIHDEIHKIAKSSGDVVGEGVQGQETAEEIISLLSEIKSSNLVQPSPEYHHCAWCSGQLITV